VTYTSEQLAAALEAAARYGYRPPPLVYSSLRPYKPPVPRKPRTLPTTEIVPEALTGPPVAPATKFEVDVSSSARSVLPPDEPVWQALLDVSVWRSRR
jgi:hypothetical protein